MGMEKSQARMDGVLGLHWNPRAFYSKNNTEDLPYLESGGWALVTLYSSVTGPEGGGSMSLSEALHVSQRRSSREGQGYELTHP